MTSRTNYCGLITEHYANQTVTVKGWAHRRRDHGGVIFIDLRDREGMLQVVCNPETAEVFATAEKVRNEFCLEITGNVRLRPDGARNNDLKSGQVELVATRLTVLNASVTPPFQIDDENLSENTRLLHRVIDLRAITNQSIMVCGVGSVCVLSVCVLSVCV